VVSNWCVLNVAANSWTVMRMVDYVVKRTSRTSMSRLTCQCSGPHCCSGVTSASLLLGDCVRTATGFFSCIRYYNLSGMVNLLHRLETLFSIITECVSPFGRI